MRTTRYKLWEEIQKEVPNLLTVEFIDENIEKILNEVDIWAIENELELLTVFNYDNYYRCFIFKNLAKRKSYELDW